ncbi:maltose acetyltransferase [Lactobacillus delbrueckii subsp. delbrueckii DSM 20074 = JCM 1012]|uniref:sugar O-acetyltransferase n=1 Tax=Lactobacillus delbrueckii TaxID=1584 RepID=UPI0006994300|nr:sugar O-acetyltransferase [Lactobacillus delbrueckii]APP09777.1 maltose acetyltransferase [Lactobacillus delbrueckii subsp. delbrueckii DSM 20074 = JCM 1012]KNZ38035.1 maltose acetyltransferase [Lactobacillus delbrueckii subsp. delbrueckii]KRK18556.1 maltose acetyltransferase [Lactobacillus delbrueckii subsp. delbrueckii DSM 20074 = JCM 1012]MCT3493476.1 sugar O-acetyltransferase [Lactobacillus delbrueckii]MCT3522273.1 sugar O-acetyltransferase [Lactobacillus delbrueckii]
MPTEKEKMLAGQVYNPGQDEELVTELTACKAKCLRYNQLPSGAEKKELLREILGQSGENCHIEPNFWCDYGWNIKVGDNFYANHNLTVLDAGGVTFGDNVFIGPDCSFYTSGHPLDAARRNTGLEYAYPITVGNNVWIGGGVRSVPGVTIGDNSVIGAGSVVVKDVPADSVAAGNPCRVIREITEADKNSDLNWKK